MNNFARVFLVLLAVFAGSSAEAQRPRLPPAGDCRQMAAQSGAESLWFGTFRGNYEDLWDRRWPLYAEGCFDTESECRRWVNEIQSIVMSPGLMRCTRGRR